MAAKFGSVNAKDDVGEDRRLLGAIPTSGRRSLKELTEVRQSGWHAGNLIDISTSLAYLKMTSVEKESREDINLNNPATTELPRSSSMFGVDGGAGPRERRTLQILEDIHRTT